MEKMTGKELIEKLNWRYATKAFDASRKISSDDWKALEEALRLAPSSFGLQPWKFIVVTDAKKRAELLPHSWGQKQIVDASHLVVFAIKNDLAVSDVDNYVKTMAAARGTTVEALKQYRDMMAGFVGEKRPGFDINVWSSRQLYIALGFFMEAAAVMSIDTCPLEGIDPAKYTELLSLKGYTVVCACAAGYRSADDKYAAAKKVRYPADQVIAHV
jgi:nitroreductase